MTQGYETKVSCFDKWWKEFSGDEYLPENRFISAAYKAGAASRQDEVYILRTEIDKLEKRLLGALLLMEELNNENTVGFMRNAMVKTLLGENNE